ncbi:MAG: hypothetical protein Q9170_008149 [Blastenia crenularia]
MAPSPSKRLTRSAKAKEPCKPPKRKATPTDSGYGGSEESWQPSYHLKSGVETENHEDPTVHTRPSRSRASKAPDVSPGKSTERTCFPDTIHGPPVRTSPRKQQRIGTSAPNKKIDTLIDPMDQQLQFNTLANTPYSRLPAQPSQTDTLPHELSLTHTHFSRPKNVTSQPSLGSFVRTLPRHPITPFFYKTRYQSLRSHFWTWAQTHFSSPSTPLNLLHLATTSPELMEYINATTSSPHPDLWDQLVQLKKAEIVYCILGKVIEMHVFGEELFGATPSQKQMLRRTDLEMVDSDGKNPFSFSQPFTKDTTKKEYANTQ